jgi:hypothetical protein
MAKITAQASRRLALPGAGVDGARAVRANASLHMMNHQSKNINLEVASEID